MESGAPSAADEPNSSEGTSLDDGPYRCALPRSTIVAAYGFVATPKERMTPPGRVLLLPAVRGASSAKPRRRLRAPRLGPRSALGDPSESDWGQPGEERSMRLGPLCRLDGRQRLGTRDVEVDASDAAVADSPDRGACSRDLGRIRP